MEFGYEEDDRGEEENKRTRGGGEADEGRDRRSYRKVGLGEEMEEMEELKKEFKKRKAKWKKEREEMKGYIRRLEKEIESEDEGGRRDGRGKDRKGEGREGMRKENERDRAKTGEKKEGGKL